MQFLALTLYLLLPIIVAVSANNHRCSYNEGRGIITCRGEHLSQIPFNYFYDKSFHTLDLGRTNITFLDIQGFMDLPSRNQIETLFLDNNMISHLPYNLYIAFPNLRRLDLSYNNLKHISRVFCHMSKLTVLNLRGNCIETSSKNAFSCLKGVEVYESKCNLMEIHPTTTKDGQRSTSTDSQSSTTTRYSLNKSDKQPIEEVKKNEKGGAVLMSANLLTVILCIWLSIYFRSLCYLNRAT